MPRSTTIVVVVDDDAAVRESLRWLLESARFSVVAFASGNDFLAGVDPERHSCILLDIRMPGLDGLAVQQQLNARKIRLPLIFLTGHADVPTAVQGMRAGAVDFFEKPFDDGHLLAGIRRSIRRYREQRSAVGGQSRAAARLATLTAREREIFELVVKGYSNKRIATRLNIAPKTAEVHRANLMRKLEAHSIAALVRLAIALGC